MSGVRKPGAAHEVDFLLRRGVSEVIVEAELRELLRSGRKLRLKEGLDPSAPDIHVGHTVVLRKLRQFQELGHQVILIVGDWTARIGDPSGASVMRPMLTEEQVNANAQTYMDQFFRVVDRDRTEVVWQSEWYGKFDLADVISLTSKFTVAQLLARDDFNNRYTGGRPIAVTELLYPLLQAQDSVEIEADVEFGGTDQKFNILMGRELQGKIGQRPQQCLLTPMLVGTDGALKMSKSLGNYIGIAEPPEDIYGKAMSIRDDLIVQYFDLVTDVPDEEVAEFARQLEGGSVNPMDLKKRLAAELVTELYDAAAATAAGEHFARVVQRKEVPEDVQQVEITKELLREVKVVTMIEDGSVVSGAEVGKPETREWNVSVPLLLCKVGLAESRSEAARLRRQGAIRIDGKTITEDRADIKGGSVIKVGKRGFAKMIDTEGEP